MAKKIKSLKKHLLYVFPLMLIISFQNCGKPQLPKDQAASDKTATRKVLSDPYEVKFLDYYQNRYYGVDTDNGRIYEYNMNHAQGGTYCMSSEELASLKAILAGAEVCLPSSASSSDQYCTMAIVEPYASLQRVGEEEILLGYASDGCAAAIDLCGNKASQFRSFIAATLTNLQSKTCSN